MYHHRWILYVHFQQTRPFAYIATVGHENQEVYIHALPSCNPQIPFRYHSPIVPIVLFIAKPSPQSTLCSYLPYLLPSFKLDWLHSLSLSPVTLTLLRSHALFCSMSLNLGLSKFCNIRFKLCVFGRNIIAYYQMAHRVDLFHYQWC